MTAKTDVPRDRELRKRNLHPQLRARPWASNFLVVGAGRLVQSGLIAPHKLQFGASNHCLVEFASRTKTLTRLGSSSGTNVPALRQLLCVEPRQEPPRQHAGDAAAIVPGGERRLHRHDLVAHKRVEPIEYARVERSAA